MVYFIRRASRTFNHNSEQTLTKVQKLTELIRRIVRFCCRCVLGWVADVPWAQPRLVLYVTASRLPRLKDIETQNGIDRNTVRRYSIYQLNWTQLCSLYLTENACTMIVYRGFFLYLLKRYKYFFVVFVFPNNSPFLLDDKFYFLFCNQGYRMLNA